MACADRGGLLNCSRLHGFARDGNIDLLFVLRLGLLGCHLGHSAS